MNQFVVTTLSFGAVLCLSAPVLGGEFSSHARAWLICQTAERRLDHHGVIR